MSKNKPQRLNEVLDLHAPEGANDRRWFLIEHQLEQVKLSMRTVIGSLTIVRDRPENESEREIAEDCLEIYEPLLVKVLGAQAVFLSYLSDTAVPERISRKEL